MQDLIFHEMPEIEDASLILGLTGWMDGGSVSTGAIGYFRERLAARRFAEIDPLDFYIFNFPVSSIPISVYLEDGRAVVQPINPMEFAALFRPHCRIEDGVIEEVVYPQNDFWVAEESNVVLFSGAEPHVRWGGWCDCIFGLAEEMKIEDLWFVGSVASPIPHTREPRIHASVSSPELKDGLEEHGIGFSEYEGPASIITSLAWHAVPARVNFRSLVVEVPHYPFLEMPSYPPSILKVAQALDDILGFGLDLSDLRASSEAAKARLDEVMAENDEFRELVTKLEEAYDYEEAEHDEDLLRRPIDTIDLEEEGGEQ